MALVLQRDNFFRCTTAEFEEVMANLPDYEGGTWQPSNHEYARPDLWSIPPLLGASSKVTQVNWFNSNKVTFDGPRRDDLRDAFMLTARALYAHERTRTDRGRLVPMVTVNLARNALTAPPYDPHPEGARLFVPRTTRTPIGIDGVRAGIDETTRYRVTVTDGKFARREGNTYSFDVDVINPAFAPPGGPPRLKIVWNHQSAGSELHVATYASRSWTPEQRLAVVTPCNQAIAAIRPDWLIPVPILNGGGMVGDDDEDDEDGDHDDPGDGPKVKVKGEPYH